MKASIPACVLAMATVVALATAPPNDDFADRIAIAGQVGSTSGSNVSATLESGEPHGGSPNTVWWTWTPPAADVYQFDTFGSSFNTYLEVYSGDVLTTLYSKAANDDALGTVQSAVCFQAWPDTEYRVQVSGTACGHVGAITLNWKPVDDWSAWMFSHSYTDAFYHVVFADDLSVLTLWEMEAWKQYYRTNALGCEERRYESHYVYTNGITITDRDMTRRIDNKLPEGINPHFSFEDYDGKLVLLRNPDTGTLTTYKMRKGTFVKAGERQIDNCGGAAFMGSEIHAFLADAQGEGSMALSRNLRKEKWRLPTAPGDIFDLGRGLVARTVRDNGILNITCVRKGTKLVSQHSITTTPAHAALYREFDSRGGVLYWTRESGTNNPLTYLDRKGRAIIDSQRLPDAGDFWMFQAFNGKMLYVRTPEGGDNFTFHAYKVKGLKHVGQKQLACDAALRNTQGVSIYTYCGTGSGLIVCDKKLKREKWSSPPAPGDILRLTKKVYFRRLREVAGGVVTLTYTLFDKKAEIVTYMFTHPE
jgi:hypothetical protein